MLMVPSLDCSWEVSWETLGTSFPIPDQLLSELIFVYHLYQLLFVSSFTQITGIWLYLFQAFESKSNLDLEWAIQIYLGRGSNNQNGNLRWFLPWRGGVSKGSRVPYTYSEKPFRIIPWLWKRVLHLVWALYYVYIVVEMTLNMAK